MDSDWLFVMMYRRITVLFALALPAAALIVAAGAAPDALACGTSNNPDDHCYSMVLDNDTTANWGAAGTLVSSCLHQPNDGNRTNQEMWDASADNNSWLEVGLLAGDAYNGTYYPNKTWFWANDGSGTYHEHDGLGTAGTNIGYPMSISYNGYGGSWEITVPNFFASTAAQGATLTRPKAGTEYTANESSGMRDNGYVSSLQREGTNGILYLWGKGNQEDFGPGSYITGDYLNAQELWAGPC